LERAPPIGLGRWTGSLIAAELGDVHEQQVWRFLRVQKIDLSGRKSWCESDDPEFVAKAADVVGLYMAPPENAIVICVDEKPSIQALERAQGYLKLPNGRTLTGHGHNYKRNGTSTLSMCTFTTLPPELPGSIRWRSGSRSWLETRSGEPPSPRSSSSERTSMHSSPPTTEMPKPFVWAKAQVHQRRIKNRRISQL
jgi:hypothetical protein